MPKVGWKHTEEAKQRMRERKLGTRAGMLGLHHTPESKQKMREAKLGKPGSRLGSSPTQETRDRISESKTGVCLNLSDEERSRRSEHFSGTNNPLWKERPSLIAIHVWVRKHKPAQGACEHCGSKKPLDCANISGEYKRDIDDYIYLCRSCHRKMDLREHTHENGRV